MYVKKTSMYQRSCAEEGHFERKQNPVNMREKKTTVEGIARSMTVEGPSTFVLKTAIRFLNFKTAEAQILLCESARDPRDSLEVVQSA